MRDGEVLESLVDLQLPPFCLATASALMLRVVSKIQANLFGEDLIEVRCGADACMTQRSVHEPTVNAVNEVKFGNGLTLRN